MSSSRRSAPALTRRALLAGVGAAAILPWLAACGFRPLYGTTASGERMADVLASIEIPPVPGRVGQKLRNELIFGTTGGGHARDAKYRLDLAIRETLSDQLVETSGEARGQVFQLDVSFKLVRLADNQVALRGTASARAAFDRFDPAFANIRARYDAENRAATTVADNIRVRLAAFLSGTA